MPDDTPDSETGSATLAIHEGTIAEATAVEAAIPEFDGAHDPQHYVERLQGRRSLILIAEDDGHPIGAGYQITGTEGVDRDRKISFELDL